MTMKSCFYPLIGDRIFGWMGDIIDVVSIVTTLFGVCTSLGLGTRQLNTGLAIINSDIPDDNVTVQVRQGLGRSYGCPAHRHLVINSASACGPHTYLRHCSFR